MMAFAGVHYDVLQYITGMESISGTNDRQTHGRAKEPDQVNTPVRGYG